jgi:hypothetical protein
VIPLNLSCKFKNRSFPFPLTAAYKKPPKLHSSDVRSSLYATRNPCASITHVHLRNLRHNLTFSGTTRYDHSHIPLQPMARKLEVLNILHTSTAPREQSLSSPQPNLERPRLYHFMLANRQRYRCPCTLSNVSKSMNCSMQHF